jgi:regulator of protease activity HflC (stomatin/prohibitin superfamily)
LYWIGLPPCATIHRFKITKETENPSGKTPEDWILGGKEEFAVDSLRFIFPRPYVLKAVELKDKTSVDLLVLAKFETVRPYVPVFYFKGKFFETAGADIRANIIDITKDLDLESFIAAPKGEVDGILSGMKDRDGKFNQTLIEQVGLRLTGISIPQYDPSDEKLRDAMNATTIAKEQGKAKVVTANAEAEAQERLATAQRIEIKETVEGFGGDTKAAAEVLRAQALAGGSITTLVDGKAPAVVPVGGGKS